MTLYFFLALQPAMCIVTLRPPLSVCHAVRHQSLRLLSRRYSWTDHRGCGCKSVDADGCKNWNVHIDSSLLSIYELHNLLYSHVPSASQRPWHAAWQGQLILSVSWQLARCLINAQPLPAHSPAADNNSLIGCTCHELTDDWSLASTHFIDSQYQFQCSYEADVLKTLYRSTIPIRFIWSICSGN